MSREELAQDAAIANALPVTWTPFFGRFGRLRPIQREAITAILNGLDALLVAPTASGKTEAVCAPLVETRFGGRDWTILYVSPTRALVNDLYERLSGPAGQLGLTLARRTGDHKDLLKATPHLLITTPESFDSLLCRGRTDDGRHVLARVSSVVLDEIHLIHGTARGEQVRWLVSRLMRIRDQLRTSGVLRDGSVQVVGLSATIADPSVVASRYLARDAVIAIVGGDREIETVAPDADSPAAESAVVAHVSSTEAPEKLLVFSNTRKRVDELTRNLSQALLGTGYEVRAHHGSLSQVEREATEAAIKNRERIVVCATMTLEIGIDIGDVDLVVLDGPAPSVSSFLQRIGRGNRRTSRTRVMMCSGSLSETIIHAAVLGAARAGELGTEEGGPQLAVARQQIASYILQAPTRARPRDQIRSLVQPLLPPEVSVDALVDHLVDSGDLEEDASGLRLGRGWRDLSRTGAIHSNIEDAGGYRVIDRASGAPIASGIRSQSGSGLGVGGKLLEVRTWERFRILVRQATSNELARGEWSYVSRAWMKGAGQPEAVRRYLGIDPDVWPVVRHGGKLCVFHFGGSRRKAVLELIYQFAGAVPPLRLDGWALWFPDNGEATPEPAPYLRQWAPSQLAITLTPESISKLERTLARPRANRNLPMQMREREILGWLDLDREHRTLQSVRWDFAAESDTRAALATIAADLDSAQLR